MGDLDSELRTSIINEQIHGVELGLKEVKETYLIHTKVCLECCLKRRTAGITPNPWKYIYTRMFH